jgi:hypothetical protein
MQIIARHLLLNFQYAKWLPECQYRDDCRTAEAAAAKGSPGPFRGQEQRFHAFPVQPMAELIMRTISTEQERARRDRD